MDSMASKQNRFYRSGYLYLIVVSVCGTRYAATFNCG